MEEMLTESNSFTIVRITAIKITDIAYIFSLTIVY